MLTLLLRLSSVFVAFCVVAIAVWFLVVSISPSYNDCINKNGQHPTENYTAEGQQIVEGPINNPTSFRLSLYCGSIFANRNGEAFTGLFTIALTFATFFLGYMAWDQSETNRAELRGYVFAEMGPVIIKAEQKPTIEIRIKNFGKTPIRKLAYTSLAVVVDLPMDIVTVTATDDEERPDLILPPDAFHTSHVIGKTAISAEEIAKIKKRESGLYFAGLIMYRDAFGKDRESRFSWVWLGETRENGDFKITHAIKGNSWT